MNLNSRRQPKKPVARFHVKASCDLFEVEYDNLTQIQALKVCRAIKRIKHEYCRQLFIGNYAQHYNRYRWHQKPYKPHKWQLQEEAEKHNLFVTITPKPQNETIRPKQSSPKQVLSRRSNCYA